MNSPHIIFEFTHLQNIRALHNYYKKVIIKCHHINIVEGIYYFNVVYLLYALNIHIDDEDKGEKKELEWEQHTRAYDNNEYGSTALTYTTDDK